MTRAALVTGGSSGIGLACARKLVELGYGVAICGRDEARLAAAQVDCGADIAMTCDVGDRVAVQRFVDAAVDSFGGLDVVVANAGTWRAGLIEKLGARIGTQCCAPTSTERSTPSWPRSRTCERGPGTCL